MCVDDTTLTVQRVSPPDICAELEHILKNYLEHLVIEHPDSGVGHRTIWDHCRKP